MTPVSRRRGCNNAGCDSVVTSRTDLYDDVRSRTNIFLVVSSRTDPYDDVVDVTSLSALDVL